MSVKLSVTRREALQGFGLVGIGAVISACGGGGGSSAAATATAAPPTSTLGPTGTAVPSSFPTSARTPTPQPIGTTPPTSNPTSTATGTTAPSTSPTQAPSATPTQTPTASGTPGTVSCVLRPQQTEGPYYLDLDLVRSDVREDRDGIALRLAIQIVNVDSDCAAIRDAVVAIWHADASGVYSGFAGQPGGVDTTGETFLRGIQVTDANGQIEFVTIYPGWYTGRTVHIHVMVHLGSSSVLTSQLYFDDALTDTVYAQAPYSARPGRNTTNDTDGVIRTGGVTSLDQVLLDVVSEGTGYATNLVIGVTGA